MYRKLSLLFAVALLVLVSGCTAPLPRVLQPEETTTGSLDISSTPQGSEIYVDGVYKGITPLILSDVTIGSHILELRYTGYTSLKKSVEIKAGTISYVDASLSPIVFPTSLLTTVPTTIPTTKPTPVPTTPVPKILTGCWKFENTTGNTTFYYMFEFEPGGSGWMTGTKTSPLKTESMQPLAITWSKDPQSAFVTVVEANPRNPADPERWVMTYNEKADVLDMGEKGHIIMIFKRVRC
jgi:outer membrane protein assembly factor BamE (lipoprotein component of BamABCDE complex)